MKKLNQQLSRIPNQDQPEDVNINVSSGNDHDEKVSKLDLCIDDKMSQLSQALLCMWHNTLLHQNTNSTMASKIHESCPHWAHCGPNLALFDLHQISAVLTDMAAQSQFKDICEQSGGLEMETLNTLKMAIDEMLVKAKHL